MTIFITRGDEAGVGVGDALGLGLPEGETVCPEVEEGVCVGVEPPVCAAAITVLATIIPISAQSKSGEVVDCFIDVSYEQGWN